MNRRDFLCKASLIAASLSLVPKLNAAAKSKNTRPNIVLIMADDMGFSDAGCYGGEIPTPNIDNLARNGLRFTQFYNTARCSPTRAALMTGLHPHQTGVGILAEDPGEFKAENAAEGYTRFLNKKCITVAEALKPAGYHTYMSGKWHLGYHDKEKWPRQRGFDRYYGSLAGATSYLKPAAPRNMTLENEPQPTPEDPSFYTTDAFADHAITFIREQQDDAPFFLYLAFTSPHWPLHARNEDIDKFVGKYRQGWDKVRQERYARLIEEKIISSDWPLSPRDEDVRDWNDLTEEQKTQMDYRMAVYAAQIYRMDWNIGRVVQTLRELGKLDNTVIIFLQDNGGCAEPYHDLGGGDFAAVNKPDSPWCGGKGTGMDGSSYGTGWANASNTPFRKFKSMLHEGGISTPLVVHWPSGLKTKPGSLTTSYGYLADIMPTAIELAQAEYPKVYNGETLRPLAGQSLVPIFNTGTRKDPEFLFWEQYGNRAIRQGKWKAIYPAKTEKWELYDLLKDRIELNDISGQQPETLEKLIKAWDNWANTHQVLPKTI